MSNNTQKERLLHIIKRLNDAQVDVCDAYETTLMSDAKSTVFEILHEIEKNKILDSVIKEQLTVHMNNARSAISAGGGGSTYERAAKCAATLTAAEAYVKDLLKTL